MSQVIIRFQPARAVHHRPSLTDRLRGAWRSVQEAMAAAATRRQLALLDDRALSDIGIGRAQAQFEAERPVWELNSFHYR